MSEGGDTPSADEVVQSTPMASLNEETAPKTDNNMSVFQRVGSLIGRKKKDKVAVDSTEDLVSQLTKELDESRKECDRYKIAHQTSEEEKKELIMKLDLKYSVIEKLEGNMEYEAKLKAKDIENLRIGYEKSKAETESLTTKMECEVKLKSMEIDNFKREWDIINEKLQASMDEIDQFKSELESKASRMTEMDDEINSKSAAIEKLEARMENEAKLKNVEIENLKSELESKTSQMTEMDKEINSKSEEIENLKKMEVEWNSRISQLENEVEAAKNGENLEISGEVTHGFEVVEKNLRSLLDRPTETIRAKFTEISKLTRDGVYSQPTEFAGVTWRILVRRNGDYLSIYLEGKKLGATEWSCAVVADFQLLSHEDDSIVENYVLKYPCVYHENQHNWGIQEFIPFEDLLKGGAVKDDSIIVAVDIKASPGN